jgi:hypothetical protein
MQDYLEKAREQVQQMELENRRFHAEMRRAALVNSAFGAALKIHTASRLVMVCAGLALVRP